MKKCPQCKTKWGNEVIHCPKCAGYVEVDKNDG